MELSFPNWYSGSVFRSFWVDYSDCSRKGKIKHHKSNETAESVLWLNYFNQKKNWSNEITLLNAIPNHKVFRRDHMNSDLNPYCTDQLIILCWVEAVNEAQLTTTRNVNEGIFICRLDSYSSLCLLCITFYGGQCGSWHLMFHIPVYLRRRVLDLERKYEEYSDRYSK